MQAALAPTFGCRLASMALFSCWRACVSEAAASILASWPALRCRLLLRRSTYLHPQHSAARQRSKPHTPHSSTQDRVPLHAGVAHAVQQPRQDKLAACTPAHGTHTQPTQGPQQLMRCTVHTDQHPRPLPPDPTPHLDEEEIISSCRSFAFSCSTQTCPPLSPAPLAQASRPLCPCVPSLTSPGRR